MESKWKKKFIFLFANIVWVILALVIFIATMIFSYRTEYQSFAIFCYTGFFYFIVFMSLLHYEKFFEWLRNRLFIARFTLLPLGYALVLLAFFSLNYLISWKTRNHICEDGARYLVIENESERYYVRPQKPKEIGYIGYELESELTDKNTCIYTEKIMLTEYLGFFGLWNLSNKYEFKLSNKVNKVNVWKKVKNLNGWYILPGEDGMPIDQMPKLDE